MTLFELSTTVSVLATAVTSVLLVLLLTAVSRQLWTLRWTITRDKKSSLPLPKGSMGWPLIGETFHWLFEGSSFHVSRREKYGNVFKTHLLGKPVIRVTGAENIRKILMGEHTMVCTQWPQSTRIILGPNTLVNSVGDLHRKKRKILGKAFSHAALETYIPHLQDVVKTEIARWCLDTGPIDVFAAAKALTFRIAVRIIIGLDVEESQINYLSRMFEQLMDNLFSLPVDVCCSGLRKGIQAREVLHSCMEKMIEEKLQRNTEGCSHVFDYILSSAKEQGHELTMQELKETAVELIFAAHSTTASASTSLVQLLLLHPSVAEKARSEIQEMGLGHDFNSNNNNNKSIISDDADMQTTGSPSYDTEKHKNCICPAESGTCSFQEPNITLKVLGGLQYLDCVVREVLRYLPPVSGGYRSVLQTFELEGCQIPKGWSVMYSIRDTHETASVYQRPDLFDPERFGPERDEGRAAGRFNYVPFGGGTRSCVGKELAQVIIKTLAVEVLGSTEMRLATDTFPKMHTVPVVHPAKGLQVYFTYRDNNIEKHHVSCMSHHG
ncbi:cytochrome P450 26B1-like [Osmerus eperlanus]|uniref:cytochrome P450 26B1-like n=1 Tax=Osmerus eperlanus TaxID=29151 RepID=UPI002E111004